MGVPPNPTPNFAVIVTPKLARARTRALTPTLSASRASGLGSRVSGLESQASIPKPTRYLCPQFESSPMSRLAQHSNRVLRPEV